MIKAKIYRNVLLHVIEELDFCHFFTHFCYRFDWLRRSSSCVVSKSIAEVESLASRTHFEVVSLSLKSSKIALSSARGQHYFLNRSNFVEKRQKPRGKFAKTFFLFYSSGDRLKKNFEVVFFEIA